MVQWEAADAIATAFLVASCNVDALLLYFFNKQIMFCNTAITL